ncbi:hypothetical protein PoMZ_07266 [Pyricularia oryzae]|uniref:Uncharacterized protein n=1 Tax=Pyricularia oryzae TaxID=318829 RepID=A0A4P7NEP2_PYROR|nr:hypothetical protein PoMZ_07266 [Pyricularia oryzae]
MSVDGDRFLTPKKRAAGAHPRRAIFGGSGHNLLSQQIQNEGAHRR